MKALIHVNSSDHQRLAAAAMALGLQRHGLEVRYGGWDEPEPCDVAVCWGGKQRGLFAAGRPVLVMERGHVGDRMAYTSCGWNGLGGRGRYPKATDGGARWQQRYGHLMQPWRRSDGYALILGQCEGDAALGDLDFSAWAERIAAQLAGRGWPVQFRPHPLAARIVPPGIGRTNGSLQEDLNSAGLCVTFNSTAGVEAVLTGVPTITLDRGAMAWPVAAHALDASVTPDRTRWAWDLAWTQWTLGEIAAGEAWASLALLLREM